MVNDLINIRLNNKILKQLDQAVKDSLYSNRSELMKTALIKFLDELQTQKALKELKKHYGEGKITGLKDTTSEEFEKIRSEIGKRSLKESGL